MKMTKVCSIIERGISADELVSQFLFGGVLPSKFIPKKPYKIGDLVYIVKEGVLTIYQCMKDGSYDDVVDSPEWSSPIIDEVTSGQSPVFGKIIVISEEEPETGIIWVRPSSEKMINPDILL